MPKVSREQMVSYVALLLSGIAGAVTVLVTGWAVLHFIRFW